MQTATKPAADAGVPVMENLYFFYDGNGKPWYFLYNNTKYFYATNLQGDVTAIMTVSGSTKVKYTYDAWGNILSVTGANAATIGRLNPLRYRGYVYDQPTGLYYLQSRYYDPNLGRFLNADCQMSGTGGALIGNNYFAYCFNNPINMVDSSGCWPQWLENAFEWVDENIVQPVGGFIEDIAEDFDNFDPNNQSEENVLQSNYFSCYKGVPVIRTNGNRSGAFGFIFLTKETENRENPEDVVRHEYGHIVQMAQLGIADYALCILLPSWQEWGTGEYYSKPWEITADIFGGVQSRQHSQSNIDAGFAYLDVLVKMKKLRRCLLVY